MINFIKSIFKKTSEEVEINEDHDEVMIAAISLMIEVSLADNVMDLTEINQLKKVLLDKFKITELKIDELIESASKNQESSTSLYEFTRKINDDYDFSDKEKLITSMWEIAYADGNIDKYEEYVIRKVSDLIYISHEDFIKSKQRAKNENS
ncbi:TerB family tellurite resistance protein [SAR86 cluster bacterium]|jgi:uncharacterized tellurite resistance protein B-like protein|nr:TerB family tellurite resistance protein [SAR86 cluster bacterium]